MNPDSTRRAAQRHLADVLALVDSERITATPGQQAYLAGCVFALSTEPMLPTP